MEANAAARARDELVRAAERLHAERARRLGLGLGPEQQQPPRLGDVARRDQIVELGAPRVGQRAPALQQLLRARHVRRRGRVVRRLLREGDQRRARARGWLHLKKAAGTA